jgi:hypothetical protein
MRQSKSKKPSAAKSKSKTRKLSVKKEPIRDLDVSELEARQVKGGIKFRAIRTED